jgi:predicted MFS family arabinose efflux permease
VHPVRGDRLRPLGVRPFGRLLGSYTVNELGDSVGIVALAVLVFDRTGKVAPTAALFLAGKFLPALIAPLLTARLDQIAVRRSLPALYVVDAAVFVGLALIAESEFLLWPVLLLALIDGAVAVTARGITRGAIAVVLQPVGLLSEGNALLNIGFAAAVVGGSAVGGLVISQAGLGVALLIDAASFVVIALVLAATRGLPPAHEEREPWLPRIRSGLEFARSDPRVRLLLGGQCLALILFTLIIPIEVVYAKESLGTTSAGFGILLASWGAGIVVGSLLYVRLRGRSAPGLILLSTAVIGLAYLGMAGAQSLLIACLLSVFGGTGNGIQWISVINALQAATPTDYQARVVGLLESALAAMPGVGYVVGGAITAASSPRAAYAVSGIGVLVLVVLAVAWLPRLRRSSEVDSRPAGAGDRTITSGELHFPPVSVTVDSRRD